MNKDLQQKIYSAYPEMFESRSRERQPGEPLLPIDFGIECGDGWFWLIDNLCKCIYGYLKQNKKPMITVDQVKEKFGCYDKETEVLTRDGWKFFRDVTKEDEIATLQDGKYLVYYKPTDIISYRYNGKMYYLNARGINLLVTPNHNLYVANGTYTNHKKNNFKRKYDFELATPDKYFRHKKRFLKSCEWIGEEPKSVKIDGYEYSANFQRNDKLVERKYTKLDKEFQIEAFLKFLGIYVAEGCCDEDRGEISIACNNVDGGKERREYSSIIKDLGYSIKTSMEKHPAITFKIYDKPLAIWLEKNVKRLAYNKRVPPLVKQLSPRLIEVFLSYLYMGDGWKTKTSETLCTTSKMLASDVEELLLKAGYSFYTYKTDYIKRNDIRRSKRKDNEFFIESKRDAYYINWLKKTGDFNMESKIKKSKSYREDWVDYNDEVYCVTVPNNVIFVKRNGKGVWCGNSLRFYYSGGDDLVFGMTWLAEHLSYGICEFCGTTENIGQTSGWITTMCEKCATERKCLDQWHKKGSLKDDDEELA